MTRQEVYGVSCILRRLATNFPVRLFSSLPDSQFPLLVASITQLTCLSAHRSVLEDEVWEYGVWRMEYGVGSIGMEVWSMGEVVGIGMGYT